MKRNTLLVAFTFLFLSQISVAQTRDEKAVSDAVEQLRTAMVNADKNALENLAAEKLSYGHSGGAVDDKKTFVDKLVSGASDFVSMDLTEQTISISGDVAIVRHVLKAKTKDAGKEPGEINLRILLIWQKEKSGWKLLARQAVRVS